MALGDAAAAWTGGPDKAEVALIRVARRRTRGETSLEIDVSVARLRKTADVVIELSGIAKGYGLGRLARIDSEMRALGLRPDGTLRSIAVETPDMWRHSRCLPCTALLLPHRAITAIAPLVQCPHAPILEPQRLAPICLPE